MNVGFPRQPYFITEDDAGFELYRRTPHGARLIQRYPATQRGFNIATARERRLNDREGTPDEGVTEIILALRMAAKDAIRAA